MENDELYAEKLQKLALDRSKKTLSGMSALELCEKASDLHKVINNTVSSSKLPVSLIAGVLINEIFSIFREAQGFDELAMMELTKEYVDVNTRLIEKHFKKYLDENYMKKEIRR